MSLWELQSSLFQMTGTKSVKCLQKGEIKWSSAWQCPAACSSSSSSFSSALFVGGMSQSATGDTNMWSTRTSERNPDRSTNASIGDRRAWHLGTAAMMMMNFKTPEWPFWWFHQPNHVGLGTYNDWIFILSFCQMILFLLGQREELKNFNLRF